MFSKYILPLIFAFLLPFSLMAQEKPELNIYTYDSFAAEWGAGPPLKEAFERKCNCKLNWLATSSSISALRKIQLEGKKSKADILLGLDSSIVGEALATDLFVKHELDLSAINVPNDWSSDYFVPFDYGYFAFIYNKEFLPNPPTSFEELIKSKKKILIQDPRSSTPGLGLVLWLKAAYKNDAKQMWREISKQVVTMTKSWSEAYNLFLKGEADMVLSYTTSPAYHKIIEQDERFVAANFSEGNYTQIEVAAIVKTSNNKQLAREFLSWLVSEEAQAIIPTTNWMYPVANIKLPKGFAELAKPENPLLLDDEMVLENKQAWILEMLDAFK